MKRRSLAFASALTCLCIGMGLMSVMVSGCQTLRSLNIQNPRYTIRDIRPRVDVAIPLSASSIDFDFTVGIDNPNPVGIKLDRLDFDLFINDSRILDSVSDQRIDIPANRYGEIRLRTRVGYSNLRNLFTEIVDVVRGNRARYEIRGNAYYDTPVGRLKFPVTVYANQR